MLNLNQTSLQLFLLIIFVQSRVCRLARASTDLPAIEVDIELGCVKLEQEVTEHSPLPSPPSLSSPQSDEPRGRTTGRLIILHLTGHRNVSVKSFSV